MDTSSVSTISKKLAVLADAAKYDASCASSGSKRKNDGGLGNASNGICHSYTPDGRCVSLLKILLTNHCVFDCNYCVNRASSDVGRAAFSPKEVVDLTLDFYRRNYIEGLFLSSGVRKHPDATMEEMIEVARALREDHRFHGYIHLKAVAGASAELAIRAGHFADRVSANIELPTPQDLEKLAPAKTHDAVEFTMAKLQGAQQAADPGAGRTSFLPAGQSTQMIVGATNTGDRSILETAGRLYGNFGLRRVYYSAYTPIPRADEQLPSEAPPLIREHRLYQADWLFRFYGFSVSELPFGDDANLPLEMDPKLAWALAHREQFPVDVNRAPRELLLRVPGMGVRGVERLLCARRYRRLRVEDLATLRISVRKARPFLLGAGRGDKARELDSLALKATLVAPRQLSLFDEREESCR